MSNKILPLAAAVCLLALGACSKQEVANAVHSRVTPENVAKIQPGMTRTQVETLLGTPSTVEGPKNFGIFTKTTATYTEGKDSVSVTYKNEEVEEKHSTVGAASTQ